jgi:hypothetical protein
MMYWFKRKYRQLRRVVDFLPIIWKGYDFDYIYALDLFKHQLKRTADFLESDKAYTVDAKQRAKRIRTALELMEKVYNEEYGAEYLDVIEQLYGKTNYEFIKLEDDSSDLYTMKTTNELAVTPEHQKQINEVSSEMAKLCRERQRRAHKLLWDFIEHNIQGWWD